MLHTVNKSPFDRNSLDACLNHIQAGSAILLIEDGIYGALEGSAFSAKVRDIMKNTPVYALAPDVEARGMAGRLMAGVQLVDYGGFVDLVTQHNKIHAWL